MPRTSFRRAANAIHAKLLGEFMPPLDICHISLLRKTVQNRSFRKEPALKGFEDKIRTQQTKYAHKLSHHPKAADIFSVL